MSLFWACVKNSTPVPPVHDTVTVHKTDTLIKTDTLHKTDTLFKGLDTPNLKNGLLLYLPFNGSFADSSGNGNVVTTVGGAALDYDMHGYAQSAFNSTGSGARVFVTNNGSIKFDTSFTLSFDIMTRSVLLQDIISMVQNTNGQGVTFVAGILGGANNIDLTVMDSTATCSDIITPGVNCLIDTAKITIQPQSWYNVVDIFHKGTTMIYVNGVLVATAHGANSTVPICASAKIIVGGWWDGDPTNLNGKLDEVRLYNRTLNNKEIAWLARNFQPGSTKVKPGVQTR